ncbi:MAG: multicopper oxidase domain-containing protein, partial [Holophagales bacterium]|nr:multicopper oxidase domain-containing protein [Holophagales bacterium]
MGSVLLTEAGSILVPGSGELRAQPRDPDETWIEPWVWHVGDWPGENLQLNVVENENPVRTVGFGNPGAVLFSYGGQTPGPTIRMRGDQMLRIKLHNLLLEDHGTTFVNHYPDTAQGNRPPGLTAQMIDDTARRLGYERQDYCLGEHTNGAHSAHVTNLHTHGLHVRPGQNPDGTYSDDVLLRVIPQADARRRQQSSLPCRELRENEVVGQASYEFQLGNVMGRRGAPHPPGTHWYHPHSHGATHNQVASGMAGFLIIEGDVDEAINRLFTGRPTLPQEQKTGAYDYRERLMLVQRVVSFFVSSDPNAPKAQSALKTPTTPISPHINGNATAMTLTMRPGAVERWRILNGSVDNRGFSRLMVVRGKLSVRFVRSDPAVGFIYQLEKEDAQGNLAPVSRQELEDSKVNLCQLAMDGITLVETQGGVTRYRLKDLSQQNPGTRNPLAAPLDPARPNASMLRNLQSVFTDATSLRNAYVRPNEVYLSPANRADLLFQA